MMLRPLRRPYSDCPSAQPGRWLSGCVAGLLLACAPAEVLGAGASPYRGLWVGQITLSHVNEVPVPLDENNVPIAPDPKVPTPTKDAAHLRLLLHVDGAGQVSLLRDVAVLLRVAPTGSSTPGPGGVADLRRSPGLLAYQGSIIARESDAALVTDERLYASFPAQPAVRIASAVFDFGDGRATEAVQAVIQAAAAAAAASAIQFPGDLSKAETAAQTAANGVLQHSDVAAQFNQFLTTSLPRNVVNDLADGNAAALTAAQTAAAALAAWSPFFPDVRGNNLVEALRQVSLLPGLTADQKRKLAQNTAAAHADITGEYARFIAGKVFGDMIAGGAAAAGTAAVVPGATAASIGLAVSGNVAVRAAQTEASALAALSRYTDTRAPDAVAAVVAAIVSGAAAQLPAAPGSNATITDAATAAGTRALSDTVARYAVPAVGPSPDYNNFVHSAPFQGTAVLAASATAAKAIAARAEDPFLTLAELTQIAADSATDALREGSPNAFQSAALAARRELPLAGAFGPGLGDPRFTQAILPASLGAPALTGTVFLPASHPTNPFRHRRHPDLRLGYDITRKIRLDFDAEPPGGLEKAGYGVDRITGVFREEIFGLHKPLGPNKDQGLRVEGRFQLNRISFIDALNAR